MKNLVIKTLQALLILAFMTIGFVFVGAFVEYKTLNGANIYAGMLFGFVLCSVIASGAYLTIKEAVLNKGVTL